MGHIGARSRHGIHSTGNMHIARPGNEFFSDVKLRRTDGGARGRSWSDAGGRGRSRSDAVGRGRSRSVAVGHGRSRTMGRDTITSPPILKPFRCTAICYDVGGW